MGGGLGGRRGIGAQLVEQVLQVRVAGGRGLVAQPRQQVRPPRAERADPRRQPVRVQAQAQHVARRREQGRSAARGEQVDGVVGVDELPVPVDDQGREGRVGRQEAGDGVGDRGHRRVAEPALRVCGGETGGQQQGVAVAQRDVEVLAEAQHQVTGGPGPSGLDEAQVPGGDAGGARERELAEPAAVAPPPQQGAHRRLR
jgi:hypothetical protein